MSIWDTAGQERYRNITKNFYKGAQGIILVYSIENRESFQNVETWKKQIEDHSDIHTCCILLANKCDLDEKERKVTLEEGKKLAEKYEMPFFETSAKKDINITEAFNKLAEDLINEPGMIDR